MDQSDATRGMRPSQIEGFLREALAGGKMSVAALEERARAAGLLAGRQTLTDSKAFRSAKAALGIRSRRVGFGPRAVWLWVLHAPPAPEVTTPVTLPVNVYEVAPSDRTPETSRCSARVQMGALTALRSNGFEASTSSNKDRAH